jgi:hypothetical protein
MSHVSYIFLYGRCQLWSGSGRAGGIGKKLGKVKLAKL